MSALSQYKDLFKESRITHKEGHVTLIQDSKIKSSVYNITGSDIPSHYILLDDLNTSCRYLYIFFRPIPRKYFLIHIDTTGDYQISISNATKEIKLRDTTLDIPYYFNHKATPTPDNSAWSCLVIDLQMISLKYFHHNHGYLKSVKVCANVLIKCVYVSDNLYHPSSLSDKTHPFPPELSFPVPHGLKYEDLYHYRLLPQLHKPHPQHRSLKITSHLHCKEEPSFPFMSLNKVIGMGVASHQQLIFSKLGSRVFFVCQSMIVAMETRSSKEQQFYIGHTDKVICIGLSGDELMLASAQLGGCVVRLWDVSNASCLSVLTPSVHSITGLSLSYSGVILCVVGRHSATGRNQISIWRNGELEIKTLTDVDISVLRVAPFDDSRMVTGGWNNIRFWRVKQNLLKSSPVNLEEYHHCSFTDVQYESSHRIISHRHVYSSTTNGCVLEIEYETFALKRVWQLFPDIPGGVAITSLALHEGFYVTGSADGFVRLWPVDFEHVTMETDHDSPVIAVGVARDGLQILTATNGSIGILDASNKKYTTLLRSHTHTITGMSLSSQWLVTSSNDNTLRVWDQDLQQVYEFSNDEKDTPTSVDIHPITNDLGVGYTSGAVRFINLITGAILSEHKLHPPVTSVVFTSDGRRGFSCDSMGSLALYDTTHTAYPLLTILGNTVSTGSLSLSNDSSLLGLIGPLPSTVTLLSVQSLQQVVAFDVSTKRKDELPLRLCFSDDVIGHVIVLTNQNRFQKYSKSNGQFVSEFMPGHDMGMSLVTVAKGHLITAGVKGDIKVWTDYHKPIEYQSYIGHNGPVTHLLMRSHDQLMTSSGTTICSWNITRLNNNNETHKTPLNNTSRPLPLDSGWPRKVLPVPATPLVPQKGVESLKATPTLSTPSENSDEIIINCTPQGGVELTLTTPTHTPRTLTCPYKATKHYSYRLPMHSKPNKLFLVPPTQSSALLQLVIGYNDNGRGTLHWLPKQGTMIYTSGSIIVKEDMQTLSQQLLIGHQTEVATIAVSNDGWSLASSSHAHNKWRAEIRLWDLDTCQCNKILHYHDVGVNCLAYSLDGRYLLSAGDDMLLSVYSIHQSTLLFSTQLTHYVHDLKWDPATAYEFATVGVGGVNFWMYEETSGDLQVHKPTMPSAVTECTALCYTSQHHLYVGSLEGKSMSCDLSCDILLGIVTVWNTRDNSCHFQWKTGCSEIGSMDCNANRLVVGGAEGVVQLWSIDPSVSKPTPVLECSFDLESGIYSMSFDSKIIMGVVATGKCVHFINWNNKHVNNLSYGHHGNIIGLSYSSDGRVLASTDDSGVTVLWSTKDWSPLQNFTTKGMVCTAVILVDHAHQLMCVCGYNDGTMVTFNIMSGCVIKRYRPHKSAITKLVSSNKVNTVLSGSDNGVVMATDTLYGSVHYTILSHQGTCISDMDGRVFAVGLPGVVSVHEELWLVSSNDQRVSLWCENTLFDWLTFPSDKDSNTDYPSLARFCPTEPDHILYTGYGLECAVFLYSLTQKKIIRKLSLNYWPTSFSVSPMGQLIAIGSKEQVLTLMDMEGTFQESSTHNHALTSLEFSPNGQQLISTSLNNIHIWEVQ